MTQTTYRESHPSLNKLFKQLANPLLAMPRVAKRGVVLGIDAGLCVLTVWLAFYLRLGEFLPLTGNALWSPSTETR